MAFDWNADIALVMKGTAPEIYMKGRTARYPYIMIEGDASVYDLDKLIKHIEWLETLKTIMTPSLTKEEKEEIVNQVVSAGQAAEQQGAQVTDTVAVPEEKENVS